MSPRNPQASVSSAMTTSHSSSKGTAPKSSAARLSKAERARATSPSSNGVLASDVATLTTNRSGNARCDVFVRPEEVAGFEGVHGVKWTVRNGAGVAYRTSCTPGDAGLMMSYWSFSIDDQVALVSPTEEVPGTHTLDAVSERAGAAGAQRLRGVRRKSREHQSPTRAWFRWAGARRTLRSVGPLRVGAPQARW